MNFEKYYLLDTNILLEDATNIYKLSQEGRNLIVLAETVLDEIDTKKSGFDEINFQAREFARILENARKEAKRFKSGLIGTEHIFIGMRFVHH